MKGKIIANGVKNLHEFGYPECNKHNILTDVVYKAFFIRMLKENKYELEQMNGRGNSNELLDIINELLSELTPTTNQ